MSKLWMFRSWSNFTISVIGVSLGGYYINSIFKEREFQKPVIEESLKILGKHKEVRTLAGFPISYIGTSSNIAVTKDNSGFYSFRISGPKAVLATELTTQAKSLSQFLDSDMMKKSDQVLHNIANKKAQKQAQINNLLGQKPTYSNRQQINKQLQDATLNLQNLQAEQREVEQTRLRVFNQFITKFSIPDKSNMQELENNKENEAPIPDHWKMWAISKLDVEIPNGSKLFIVPNAKQQTESRVYLPRWTYAALNNKLKVQIQDLSSQEVSAYSQQKTSTMYSKYNNHRLMTILMGTIFAVSLFLYQTRNKLIPLNKSIFLNEVKTLFERHPKIRNMGKFHWSEVTRGGRRGPQVDVEIDVMGEQRGYVKVSAVYTIKNDEYKIKKAEFVPSDKKVNPIDLLKP